MDLRICSSMATVSFETPVKGLLLRSPKNQDSGHLQPPTAESSEIMTMTDIRIFLPSIIPGTIFSKIPEPVFLWT
jgi:hypothetical protein